MHTSLNFCLGQWLVRGRRLRVDRMGDQLCLQTGSAEWDQECAQPPRGAELIKTVMAPAPDGKFLPRGARQQSPVQGPILSRSSGVNCPRGRDI